MNTEPNHKVLRLRDDDVVWRAVEEEIVILDRLTWEYLTVNHSGTVLWRSLVGGATRNALVRTLIHEYEIGEDLAAGDVDAFLSMLGARNLLAA